MAIRGIKSIYTDAIADEICQRLSDGESLNAICKDAHLPAESTVRLWALDNREGFAAKYSRAREIGDDVEFERLNELACEVPREDARGSVDSGWVNWRRLQVNTMMWTLARKRPKKYGDRVQNEISGELGVKRVVCDI